MTRSASAPWGHARENPWVMLVGSDPWLRALSLRCVQERPLVAFSCKGRGLCPSCTGRRMATLAAHLTDAVLGGLPVRQWVLSLPYRLRYSLAWDHRLCRRVLAVFLRVLLGFERRRARRLGHEDALERLPGGSVLLHIRRPWSDGTRAIVLEPLALLARLAALIPRPRINLLIYHGIFAPHAKRRREALAAGALAAEPNLDDGGPNAAPASGALAGHPDGEEQDGPHADRRPLPTSSPAVTEPPADREASPEPTETGEGRGHSRTSRWVRWADLLRRVFEIDVLTCRHCGGPLRLVATIDDPVVIRRILRHLGLPWALPEPLPARPPPIDLELSLAQDLA